MINGGRFRPIEQIESYGNTGGMYLVYDVKTKVKYILSVFSYGYSISPYYDETGNVAFYEGE